NWTEAVLVIAVVPDDTVTVTVACAPALNAPSVQVKTVPVCVHTPCVVVVAWNVPGNVSVRVTRAASPGPLLEIVMVKVTNPPAPRLAGEVIVIPMSVVSGATGVTGLEGADSTLLPVELVACTVKV